MSIGESFGNSDLQIIQKRVMVSSSIVEVSKVSYYILIRNPRFPSCKNSLCSFLEAPNRSKSVHFLGLHDFLISKQLSQYRERIRKSLEQPLKDLWNRIFIRAWHCYGKSRPTTLGKVCISCFNFNNIRSL